MGGKQRNGTGEGGALTVTVTTYLFKADDKHMWQILRFDNAQCYSHYFSV